MEQKLLENQDSKELKQKLLEKSKENDLMAQEKKELEGQVKTEKDKAFKAESAFRKAEARAVSAEELS